MSRFASIKTERGPAQAPAVQDDPVSAAPSRTTSRHGKKAIGGYFSADLSKALHLLALEQGVSLQAMMGEAFDDLMRKYGKHPFGER